MNDIIMTPKDAPICLKITNYVIGYWDFDDEDWQEMYKDVMTKIPTDTKEDTSFESYKKSMMENREMNKHIGEKMKEKQQSMRMTKNED